MHPTHVHRCFIAPAAVAAVALFAGCGPVQAASAISDGTRALEEAERFEAESFARYHYHKATLLLTEAKRRNGFGDYEVARQWADEAANLALEASRTARARRELERRKKRARPGQVTPPPAATPPPVEQPEEKPDDEAEQPQERRPIKPPTRRKILPPGMNEPGGDQ